MTSVYDLTCSTWHGFMVIMLCLNETWIAIEKEPRHYIPSEFRCWGVLTQHVIRPQRYACNVREWNHKIQETKYTKGSLFGSNTNGLQALLYSIDSPAHWWLDEKNMNQRLKGRIKKGDSMLCRSEAQFWKQKWKHAWMKWVPQWVIADFRKYKLSPLTGCSCVAFQLRWRRSGGCALSATAPLLQHQLACLSGEKSLVIEEWWTAYPSTCPLESQ